MTPIGDLGIALKADVDDYHKAVRSSRDATGLLTGSIRGLSAAMRNMGIVVTASSALAGAGMVALTRRAERVNAAFREVDTITNSLTSSQEEYGELVSELNTEFALQENRVGVINGLYQSLSAGIEDTEEAQREFLTTAGQLATVGLVDLETSVDVLSTVLNTYNMETDEAERVSESLFRTVQLGKVTLDELAPVMGRIAALGSEMGVSIEELGASMAQLTRNGFEARIAATGLRAVLRGFMRPSDDMADALRDIAFEQDGLVESLTKGHDVLDGMADEYRNLTSRVQELSDAQREARGTQEDVSLSIQRARLAITAIEEDRVDAIEDSAAAEMAQSNSISELEDKIEDYQFQVNEARIAEEEARLTKNETENEVQNLKDSFVEELDAAGDLEDGIGQLFLENEGLVDTLVQVNEGIEDSSVAMDDLFPRTRGLQAALALLGEDSENFLEILEGFEDGTLDVEEAWEGLSEEMREEEFDGDIENFRELKELDMEQEFENMLGPQENMRNSMSELGEVAERLGQIFTEDVTETISGITSAATDFVDRFEEMDEGARQAIGRFGVLAVSIGLVLGPMLFLGGQIALMASAMGSALLPVLLIATFVFSVFAGAISAAITEGEESEGIFSSMEGVLSSLIGFLSDARGAFEDLIAPRLVSFGKTLISLFELISFDLATLFDSSESSESALESFAGTIGSLIARLDGFISQNKNLISLLVRDLVEALIDVSHFARGLLDVFISILSRDDVQTFIMAVAAGVVLLAVNVASLLGTIGRWLSRNDDLVAGIVTVVAVIGGLIFAAIKFITVVGAIATTVSGIIATIQSFAIALNMVLSVMGPLTALKTVIISLFPTFVKGVTVLTKVLGVLAKGVAIVVGALSAKILIIAGIIALFATLVASIWIARDEILDALLSIWGIWFSIFKAIQQFITGEINWREMGSKIVESLAEGLTSALGSLRDAASKVASTIGEYLPTSPADKGYFSDNPPEDIGSGISEDVADGMNLEDDISTEFGDLDDSEFDVESDMETFSESEDESRGSSIRGMGEESAEINIEEGAIKVGPFEGISDEELPRKVGDEVDESLDQIVQRLEAKGVEIE